MRKSYAPWHHDQPCPLEGFAEFKKYLDDASYHYAADTLSSKEDRKARESLRAAAELAIKHKWPLWVMSRMFGEAKPLVDFNHFLQILLSLMYEKLEASANN